MVVFLVPGKVPLVPLPCQAVKIQFQPFAALAVDKPEIALFRWLNVRFGEKLDDNRYGGIAVYVGNDRFRVRRKKQIAEKNPDSARSPARRLTVQSIGRRIRGVEIEWVPFLRNKMRAA